MRYLTINPAEIKKSAAPGLTVTVDDANTASVVAVLNVRHTTTGTAAAGIGSRLVLQAEDGAGNVEDAVYLDGVLTVVTDGAEQSNLDISVRTGSGIARRLRMTATGALRLGTDSFAKATTLGAGEIALDNGTTDTPGIHFYTAANTNMGIDVDGGALRVVRNMNEVGGTLLFTITSASGAWSTASVDVGWTLRDNRAAGLSIGASGAASMLVLDTRDGLETLDFGAFVRYALGSGVRTATLAATDTLTRASAHFQRLDPGGAGRTVLLPPEAAGLWLVIENTADAAEDLSVREDLGVTTIGTLNQNEMAWFICDATTWRHMGITAIGLT